MDLGPRAAEPPARKAAEPRERENVSALRNYVIKSGRKSYRIFRGDMHRHTEISLDGAGEGSLIDAYRYAIDAANFDFVAVTDHMHGLSEFSWWRGEKTAEMFHVPGFFIALFGYERSIGFPNGHRNVVSPKRGVHFLPVDPHENMGQGRTLALNMVDTEMQMAAGKPLGDQVKDIVRSADVLYPYLRKHGAIAMAHTPVNAVMGTDWGGPEGFTTDPEVEPLVEIFQGSRISSEHEGAPLTPSKHEPGASTWRGGRASASGMGLERLAERLQAGRAGELGPHLDALFLQLHNCGRGHARRSARRHAPPPLLRRDHKHHSGFSFAQRIGGIPDGR